MVESRRPLFQTTTLADQVYEYLIRQISKRAYPPGSPLRELDLVAQLGVSRTPIREALLRLAEYGLLESGGRSARVCCLTRDDILHIYQVRRALEGQAIKLACGRFTDADFDRLAALTPRRSSQHDFEAACYELDRELHRLIAVRSGNPILAKEIGKLHDRIQLMHQPVAAGRGRLNRELQEHRDIIAALRTRDPSACYKAMLRHLRRAYQEGEVAFRRTAQGNASAGQVGSPSAASGA
jgi:DNA-binding GntR family transcriptional regulator